MFALVQRVLIKKRIQTTYSRSWMYWIDNTCFWGFFLPTMFFYSRMFSFLTDKIKHTSVTVIAEIFHSNAKQKGKKILFSSVTGTQNPTVVYNCRINVVLTSWRKKIKCVLYLVLYMAIIFCFSPHFNLDCIRCLRIKLKVNFQHMQSPSRNGRPNYPKLYGRYTELWERGLLTSLCNSLNNTTHSNLESVGRMIRNSSSYSFNFCWLSEECAGKCLWKMIVLHN